MDTILGMSWTYMVMGWFAAMFAWLAQGVTIPRWWFFALVAGFAVAIGRSLIGLMIEIGRAMRHQTKE